MHILSHCWLSWKTWKCRPPSLAELGGLEKGWPRPAVVYVMAEPAGAKRLGDFSAKPEMGRRKLIFG